MVYDSVESTYEHLRKLGNEHKEACDSFWVYEQEWNRKLDKLEALVEATVLTKNKIIDEKDQAIRQCEEGYHELRIKHERDTQLFKEIVKEKDQAVQRAQNSNETATKVQRELFEKDQVIKDLSEKLDEADEIIRLKDVWKGHSDTWKANYEREAKRCKELESKLEDPTREVRDLRLKLAQANATREGELELRYANEATIKRLEEKVFGLKEDLLNLASRLSK